MEQHDFDIDGLAEYLHLTPTKVSRLADRGKLPGRKVAGAWRFSRADIHHWLEDRIGVSDEDQLTAVEDVLQRDKAAEATEPPSLSKLLLVEAIAVPLLARTRNSVISNMVKLAAQTGMLWDPDKMADAVRARENLHPTALDNGVALLHPRRPMPNLLAQALLALGRTHHGIPFGGGTLTDTFFLICSTSDREHLQTLTRLSRLIGNPDFMTAIREAEDAVAAHQVVQEFEADLPT